MFKVVNFEERFPTGELTIQRVLSSNGRGGRLFEKRAFDRAADSPVYAYLDTITPRPGHSILLVNAMGAFETYDDNRNGDGFTAREYKRGAKATCGHSKCQDVAWVPESDSLVNHYKSFEEFGRIYKHHANSDPKKSFGTVMKALWNPRMQRVELVLDFDESTDKDLAKRLADGEFPAVSMGCKVPWDVCTICGHRAPTRKDYCEHARDKLRQVLADGRKVSVLNPRPKFFDISIVYRPADPTGFMFKKVAHEIWTKSSAELGEEVVSRLEKEADVRKLSEIQKRLLGLVTSVKTPADAYSVIAKKNAKARAPMTAKEAAQLATVPTSVLASSAASAGHALSAGEFARTHFKRAGLDAPEWLLDRVVAVQPLLREAVAQDPDFLEKVSNLLEFDRAHVDNSLREKVAAYSEHKLAGISDYLAFGATKTDGPLGAVPVGPAALYRAQAPARTDMLTITDPNTGHVYQTMRGAAQDAHNARSKHQLAGTTLLTMLYSLGLNKAVPKAPWLLKAPVAVGGAVATMRGVNNLFPSTRNPEYLTDQGVMVPGTTEFAKLSAASVCDTLVFDYVERGVDSDEALRAKVAAFDRNARIARFLSEPSEDGTKAAAFLDPKGHIDVPRLFDVLGSLLLS